MDKDFITGNFRVINSTGDQLDGYSYQGEIKKGDNIRLVNNDKHYIFNVDFIDDGDEQVRLINSNISLILNRE